ncbi:MAG TPA: mitochondrial fission ELM1 family protein [Alphaproteobacteria bacterium]|nr:mitochondrial fission ELM1 family protein [Alphaproteobacteria bacterium]HNS43956.1 mitochondrial fission ELM1 family protein [Alphaproteobacteria bacterium]
MAGTENQCLGVAESLGIPFTTHRVSLNQPWKALSPWLGWELSATFCPPLLPPWPDVLIASGRKSIAASRYIKKQSCGKTFTVQIQDPRVPPTQFDLVAVPEHDPTRGENVIVTNATPNRITAKELARAKEEFAYLFEKLPATRIAVMIGGSTKTYKITQDDINTIMGRILPLSRANSLMISTSRRTGDDNTARLKKKLDIPHVYFWDGGHPNPYMGMLAWADVILVTNDSTSMISDAATTGKPVYVLPLVKTTYRQQLLVDNLERYGAIRPFSGKIDHWTYPPLNDSAAIAAVIREKSGLFVK